MTLSFTGIDPGMHDTAVVNITFDFDKKEWTVHYTVLPDVAKWEKQQVSVDMDKIKQIVEFAEAHEGFDIEAWLYIEGYRPRGNNIRQDAVMRVLIQTLSDALDGSKVLDNTGVKHVVTEEQLELLKVRRFSVSTYHSDLKSAARIALVGAVKDEYTNAKLYEFVLDQLEGRPWTHNHQEMML